MFTVAATNILECWRQKICIACPIVFVLVVPLPCPPGKMCTHSSLQIEVIVFPKLGGRAISSQNSFLVKHWLMLS